VVVTGIQSGQDVMSDVEMPQGLHLNRMEGPGFGGC